MRFWFIPVASGDFRLESKDETTCTLSVENVTEEERATLRDFLTVAREKKWIPAEAGLALGKDKAKIEIDAPIQEVGKVLAPKVIEDAGEKAWTVLRSKEGTVSVLDGVEVKAEAEAAASIAKPRTGCPAPTPCSRRPSEVLRAFCTQDQWRDYCRTGSMKVIGNASGKAFRLYHRDEAAKRGLSRCIVDVETGDVVCAWDAKRPPEEETLALKIALEHREKWLRSLEFIGE